MANPRAALATILTRLGLTRPARGHLALASGQVDALAKERGGLSQPVPFTQTRWYIDDVETATRLCDTGDISMAARLMRAAMADGVLAGVLSTRTGGLVRLPKRFRGAEALTSALTGGTHRARTVFDEMCPDAELALLAADGVLLGVGVAELLGVEGRAHPVLTRLDPEFLRYVWSENQWYYKSIGGMLPITPGDGRWVLHIPGGAVSPWQAGMWRAVGTAFIRKSHANMCKDNWEAKLAHPARVATIPLGATDVQGQKWFQSVLAWGINTVFGLLPGYDVKLLESNGRGADSFRETIKEQNYEFQLALAGQTVTTDGGAGFSNADVHKSIRADLIKATADGLSGTINTQVLPPWVVTVFDEDAVLSGGVVQEWDVSSPHDRNGEASAMVTTASAITTLTEALAPHGLAVDARALCDRAGIPVTAKPPKLTLVEGGKSKPAPASRQVAA